MFLEHTSSPPEMTGGESEVEDQDAGQQWAVGVEHTSHPSFPVSHRQLLRW